MGYALIWVESLAAGLLLVALVTAWAGRWPRHLGRGGIPVLVAVLLVAAAGAAAWGLGYLMAQGVVVPGTFAAVLAWAAALAVGLVIVLARGLGRSGEGDGPAARAWAPGRLALAFVAAVVLACITVSNMDLAMKVQLAAIRAESGAKILALVPPRVPDRDNAAPVYREAFEALTVPEQLPTPWKEKLAVWFDPAAAFDYQDKDLADFLAGQERGLALLRQAAAMPGCWFERDYFQSIDLLLPEIDKLRHGANLLALDARAKARRGDVRGALDSAAAVFGVARHANEPILICLITSAAMDRTAAVTLEDVLARATPKPDDLGRVTIPDVSYRDDLRRCIQTEEAALGLPVILSAVDPADAGAAKWLHHHVPPLAVRTLDSPLYRVFFLADDLAAYRRVMRSFLDLAGRPYHEARADWDALDKDILARRGGGILSGLLLPNVTKCAHLAARTDATHRLAQLALAAEAYRAKTGNLPESPDELTPDYVARIPTDPCAGRPLRLKRDGKDLLLYSVGPDGKDDGGAPWDEARKDGDLVFRLRGR
jgi:hypothetical protein